MIVTAEGASIAGDTRLAWTIEYDDQLKTIECKWTATSVSSGKAIALARDAIGIEIVRADDSKDSLDAASQKKATADLKLATPARGDPGLTGTVRFSAPRTDLAAAPA